MPAIGALISYATFALLALTVASTARAFWRARTLQQFDIFLVAASLGALLLLSQATSTAGRSPAVHAAFGILIIVQPYCVLRLVCHFWPVRQWVVWATIASMFAGTAIHSAWPTGSEAASIPIGVYYVGVLSYAAMAFSRQARRSGGVVARRLRLMAAASWSFVGLVACLGLGMLAAAAAFRGYASLLVILIVTFFYLALATPRRLRRSWQSAELYRHLVQATRRSTDERAHWAAQDLCDAAARMTSADSALVIRAEAAPGAAREAVVVAATHAGILGRRVDATDGILDDILSGRVHDRRSNEPDAHTLALAGDEAAQIFAVPVDGPAGVPWGALVVAFVKGSLFGDDDLEVMHLLADQASSALEHAAAVEQQLNRERRAHTRQRLALEDTQQRLTEILDATPDFVTISQINGPPLYLNRAARQMFGVPDDEALPTMFDVRPDEYPELFRRTIVPALLRDGIWRGETSYVSRDGRAIPVSQVSVLHRGSDRDIEYVSTIARDITEQRRSADALREAEERMRFALEASNVGVWEANLGTGVSYWSPTCEALHGLAPGTFGRSLTAFLDSIHPDQRDDVRRRLETAAAERRDADLEYDTIWPDGTTRTIVSKGRVFYDAAGTPLRAAGVAWDVTARRSLEEQLRQSQKMEAIGQLAGGVAHDFNNILTTILISAEELQAACLPPDARETAAEIEASGRRAAALTRQLLAFGRRQVLRPQRARLSMIVTALLPMLRRLLGEQIRVIETVHGNEIELLADVHQIEQIVMNLVVNARDAMPDGGTLTFETFAEVLDAATAGRLDTAPGLCCGLRVSDTGTGMDDATCRRIFEPFFTTKEIGRGTGLGLSTVYGIVKQMQGAIDVSTAPGAGTTFTLRFPGLAAAAAHDHPAPREAPSTTGRETILVVEDEPPVRTLAARVLTQRGYRVLTAAGPAEAETVLAEHGGRIDLILTDVRMPGGSGVELAARIFGTHPTLPVVFMSGYGDAGPGYEGWLADAGRRVLAKPFTGAALAATVREALDAL